MMRDFGSILDGLATIKPSSEIAALRASAYGLPAPSAWSTLAA
jgi:hypothetical protein